MGEDEFLRMILQMAGVYGWRTAHFRPALTKHGNWITAVQGDGKGFPDLLLLKGSRIMAIEAKSQRGKLTYEQELWLAAFAMAGITTYVWRPSDWTEIELVLREENR